MVHLLFLDGSHDRMAVCCTGWCDALVIKFMVSIDINIQNMYCSTSARDSSVGRAEDCSGMNQEILRSPVRLRFAGIDIFTYLFNY